MQTGNTLSRICACLMRMRKVRTGAKLREWCYTLIRKMNAIGFGRRSIAIYRELNGFRGAVIVTCYKMAGRPEATASYVRLDYP